jgi:sodium-dependent phosphate cotransporter
LFLIGVGFLEAGIAALGERFQAGLLRSVSHPLSGLCAGLLATVLVQSSSVTTATIVGMVGAGTLPLVLAVPMVMGANIGTTVTSTLASLGSIRRAVEFRRAFAAATVHDFFNLIAVAVLLPLEVATGFLQTMGEELTEILLGAEVQSGGTGRSPLRAAVRYPVGIVSSALEGVPLAGMLQLGIGICLIFLALTLITRHMRRLVASGVELAVNRMIGRGGGALGILVGIGVTVAVQSSTITTSILVPIVASGVLTLRNAFPITIGANIGTTVTALLASLAVVRPEGLTIALVHTLFNVTATAIIYPVARIRNIPVALAERIAEIAARRHAVVFVYGLGVFVVLPLLGLFLLQ